MLSIYSFARHDLMVRGGQRWEGQKERQKLHKGQEDGKKNGSEKDIKYLKKTNLFKKNLREGVKWLINKAKKGKKQQRRQKDRIFWRMSPT